MANTSSTSSQSVPRAGLRATLRFRWRSETEPIMVRDLFGRTVVLGALKLKMADVYCLQTNSQERSYDVTFDTHACCEKVMGDCRRLAGERPLAAFEVISLDRPNFRIVTIHLYNPYVSDQAVTGFLARYADVLTAPRMVKDSLGFWTGKRQYQVLLKEETGGHEGYAHPPAFFSIGADRGYLFYSRQPQFCRRCRGHGHADGACGLSRCRFCSAVGHEAKDCPEPRACHVCRATDHLAKDCPKGKGTYASTVSGGRRKATAERSREKEGGARSLAVVAAQGGGERKLPPLEEVIAEVLANASSYGDGQQPRGAQGAEETSMGAPAPGRSGGEATASPVPTPRGAAKKRDLDEAREGGQVLEVLEEAAFGEGPTVEGEGVPKKAKGAEGGGEPVGAMQGQEEMDTTGTADMSAGDVADFGLLSPLGLDAYEGPLRPSPAPNVVPYSWAEASEIAEDDVYG